ncbi:MAG: acetyl-CoA C-acetyltransferase [Anaerolineales bacterium]|nr:acetyl-CoA C-acetyltransferase [Anaerolineales bacterium]
MKDGLVILEGARTPFGSFMGALRSVSATDLGAVAARGALERSRIDPALVGHVVFGNILPSSADAAYISRHVGLKAGLPVETPALTLNRQCGSGLDAVLIGAKTILAEETECVLAGGAENMSLAPYVLRGAREGWGLGQGKLEDYLWEALTDSYPNMPMGVTAENLAECYGISRAEQDAFAVCSQQRAAAARASGRLAREIVPVEIPGKKGATVVEQDEYIRPGASVDKLGTLPARFKSNGTVTAGNASGINDGGAAVVICTERLAAQQGLTPLGRLVSWATVGVDPAHMGIGPVPATRKALERAGLRLDDIDLFEVNEAFAAQYLAVEKTLGLDRDRTNVNGGAIALGHPLAASGARLLLTLLYELRERSARYGVAALCIGGGQGIAAIVENSQR